MFKKLLNDFLHHSRLPPSEAWVSLSLSTLTSIGWCHCLAVGKDSCLIAALICTPPVDRGCWPPSLGMFVKGLLSEPPSYLSSLCFPIGSCEVFSCVYSWILRVLCAFQDSLWSDMWSEEIFILYVGFFFLFLSSFPFTASHYVALTALEISL